jgi:hypothetical protein
MNIFAKYTILFVVSAFSATVSWAKLPAPSDEAKAKAAEAAAKTAWVGKVDNYKLCLSQDKVASRYYADAKRLGKDAKPATATAACADPGAFVYPPPAAPAAATAPTTAAPAVATAPVAPVKK